MRSRLTLRASRSVGQVCRDLGICLQFYSRLPLRVDPWSMAELARALRLAPLAGAVTGLAGAFTLLIGGAVLGLPALVAATLAVVASVLATGGLHEDGLADVADGFGGGATAARKLEIMKDSRIGSFGALALILSVGVRVGAIATLVGVFGCAGCGIALVAAGAASRGFGLMPLAILPPARPSGLGQAAGQLPKAAFATALALATIIALAPMLWSGIAPWRPALACLCAAVTAFGVTWQAKRHIGGQTGDVAGAAQQLCEISYLVALLIAPGDG
ncbi:MAG TPA: adenosylcobinamide-GDP ribazoletransferase [Lichenihabitans sp.]|jgi:adenosylcobinamide-GDP ribazoletransferase|nr:adenosylcobinamide-GDP ribazoletransferase [Lichenihabitans sp.]